MKKSDIISLLEEQLQKHATDKNTFSGDKNPQVKALYDHSCGSYDATEAILHYIKTGSKAYF